MLRDDIANNSLERQARILLLRFAVHFDKPTGMPEELYKECLSAFNSHRGKVEWQEDAILKVLQNYKGDHP